MKRLNKHDFGEMFGVSSSSFSSQTLELINSTNFRYREIRGLELEQLILRILQRIDGDRQIVGAPERKTRWEDGWKENLDAFRETNFSEDSLVPRFIRHGQPLRLNQDYVSSEDPNFELNFVRALRSWLAFAYFAEMDEIHEFGCGTGFNLLAFSELLPERRYFGSDFVSSSVDLVNLIAREKGINLSGQLFDMKCPDYSYKMGPKSGVLTFGSIEQLAGDIDPMINFLLSQKHMEVCIHVEPAEELYDLNNLSDFLAYRFQSRRKYTSSLIGKLRDLELRGHVELLKVKRLFFGSLFMEGYNVVAWRKKGD